MGLPPTCRSFRRWTGSELLARNWCCIWPMDTRSVAGDMDMVRWPGDGVDSGEPWLEPWLSPLSDRDPWLVSRLIVLEAPRANAAAVARAASSIVPVWWFWCRVNVVRRVNVFWQSA